MGDVAEMMMDGTLCESCGAYIEAPNVAEVPRKCFYCKLPAKPMKLPSSNRQKCPKCGKRLKSEKPQALEAHDRDVHERAAARKQHAEGEPE